MCCQDENNTTLCVILG